MDPRAAAGTTLAGGGAAIRRAECPLWHSDESARWPRMPSEHENDSRRRSWHHPANVVDGERPSPFVVAAVAAEQTTMVTNWSSAGVGFINTGLTWPWCECPTASTSGWRPIII